MAKQFKSLDLNKLYNLVVPSSSREVFVEDVCGLPNQSSGCNSCQSANNTQKNLCIPALGEPTSDIDLWILWGRYPGHNYLEEPQVIRGRIPSSQFLEQFSATLLFGFNCEKVRQQNDIDSLIPEYVDYRIWNGGQSTPIDGWFPGQQFGLSSVVGNEVFKSFTIPVEINGQSRKYRTSISQFISSYITTQCPYRQLGHPETIAVSLCHTEIYLESILSDLCVTFSYLDPEILENTIFSKVVLGGPTVSKEPGYLLEALQPIKVSKISESSLAHSTFADSLSRKGSYQVLPEEIGNSFLCFSVGEIATYLLYWGLLRVIANKENQIFCDALKQWHHEFHTESGKSYQLFESLLSMKVKPCATRALHTEDVLGLPRPLQQKLHFFEESLSFEDYLSLVKVGGLHHTIIETIQFLSLHFSLDSQNTKFLKIPMYQGLNWEVSEQLKRKAHSLKDIENGKTDRKKLFLLLESVVSSILPKSTNIFSKSEDDLQKEVDRLVEQSVFPISYIVQKLAQEFEFHTYYIFPVWEEEFSKFVRPVVFAHAFVNHDFVNISHPDYETLQKERFLYGKELQHSIQPLGIAVSHEYYREIHSSYESHKVAQESERLLRQYQSHAMGTELVYIGSLLNLCKKKLPSEGDSISLKKLTRIFNRLKQLLERGKTVEDALRSIAKDRLLLGHVSSEQLSIVERVNQILSISGENEEEKAIQIFGLLEEFGSKNTFDELSKELDIVIGEARLARDTNKALLRVDTGEAAIEVEKDTSPRKINDHRFLSDRLTRALTVVFSVFFERAFPSSGKKGEIPYLRSMGSLFGDDKGKELSDSWREFVATNSYGDTIDYEVLVSWVKQNMEAGSRFRVKFPEETQWRSAHDNVGLIILEAWIQEAFLNALKYVQPAKDGISCIGLEWDFEQTTYISIFNSVDAEHPLTSAGGGFGSQFLEYSSSRMFPNTSFSKGKIDNFQNNSPFWTVRIESIQS